MTPSSETFSLMMIFPIAVLAFVGVRCTDGFGSGPFVPKASYSVLGSPWPVVISRCRLLLM